MNILIRFENRVFCSLSKARSSRVLSNGCSNFISRSRCSSNSTITHKSLVEPAVCSLIVRRLPAGVSLSTRSAYRSVFDVDTNVKKDVLLYEHDSTFFYSLNYLLVGQLVTWLSFAYLFVKVLKAIPDEDLKQTRILDLTQKKWQILIPSSFVFAGSVIFILGFIFCRLSVKKIILLKGGNSIYLETFGFWGMNIRRTLSLEDLTCSVSRTGSKGYVPLKRRKKMRLWANYLIDVKGKFKDPDLFDMTVGLQRVI